MFSWSQHFRIFPNGSISGIQENRCSGVVTVSKCSKTWGGDIIQMLVKYVFQHHFLIHISAQMSEENMMTHTHTHTPWQNLQKKKQALLPLRENTNRSIYPQFWLTHPKWRKWVLRPSDLYPQPTGSPERSSKGFHRDSYSIPGQVGQNFRNLDFPEIGEDLTRSIAVTDLILQSGTYV